MATQVQIAIAEIIVIDREQGRAAALQAISANPVLRKKLSPHTIEKILDEHAAKEERQRHNS